MVTLKEHEAYLKVKRFIDGHNESEIISRLMDDNKYVPLIIESNDADPIKYYSISAAARHCGVTKQTLDYVHKHRCSRIVRRKGGVKNLESLGYRFIWTKMRVFKVLDDKSIVKLKSGEFCNPIFSTIPL